MFTTVWNKLWLRTYWNGRANNYKCKTNKTFSLMEVFVMLYMLYLKILMVTLFIFIMSWSMHFLCWFFLWEGFWNIEWMFNLLGRFKRYYIWNHVFRWFLRSFRLFDRKFWTSVLSLVSFYLLICYCTALRRFFFWKKVSKLGSILSYCMYCLYLNLKKSPRINTIKAW